MMDLAAAAAPLTAALIPLAATFEENPLTP
jgi:hypothetical protein